MLKLFVIVRDPTAKYLHRNVNRKKNASKHVHYTSPNMKWLGCLSIYYSIKQSVKLYAKKSVKIFNQPMFRPTWGLTTLQFFACLVVNFQLLLC